MDIGVSARGQGQKDHADGAGHGVAESILVPAPMVRRFPFRTL